MHKMTLGRNNGRNIHWTEAVNNFVNTMIDQPLLTTTPNPSWTWVTSGNGLTSLEKNEANLTVTLSVYAKTPKEQNKKLADELRKLADKLEAEAFEEDNTPDKESVVNTYISRG